jgi:hypothetical protein
MTTAVLKEVVEGLQHRHLRPAQVVLAAQDGAKQEEVAVVVVRLSPFQRVQAVVGQAVTLRLAMLVGLLVHLLVPMGVRQMERVLLEDLEALVPQTAPMVQNM